MHECSTQDSYSEQALPPRRGVCAPFARRNRPRLMPSPPGISGLSPDLRNALEQATRAAREEGVEIFINSGWRSPALQEQLLTDAVSDYGSLEEAARWVATPETSAHVSGDAVDIGDLDAYLWFQERSSGFGLCQVYANEPWHYEYRPDALSEGCPQPYLDPTHDPTLQN